MAPNRRGGVSTRGGSFRGRGQGRGRGGFRGKQASGPRYRASRIQEVESVSGSGDDSGSIGDIGGIEEEAEEEPGSSEEEEADAHNSYAALLQSLNAEKHGDSPAKKKRKLHEYKVHIDDSGGHRKEGTEQNGKIQNPAKDQSGMVDTDPRSTRGESGEVDDQGDDEDSNSPAKEDDQQEEDDFSDPFDQHFVGERIPARLKALQTKKWKTVSSKVHDMKRLSSNPDFEDASEPEVGTRSITKPTHLKSRLHATGHAAWDRLDLPRKDVGAAVLTYRDVIYGARSVKNSGHLRDLVCLHALNHVLKTRDRVLKNNVKLARDTSGDIPELRDQGFTRPKVLFILPTKHACVRFVESLVTLSEPDQQENKARFLDNFASPEESKEWGEERPEDFRELFSGNDDDMFRIGLKFTRKTLKFFSPFYTSDIILASPLGLRTAIETSGKDKSYDADFLSSIEITIIDHADALLMQNWQHVEYIFSQLNLLPKDAHGCDFTRVRTFYLDNLAKYFRQTIILSSFLGPEINSLSTTYLLNHAGKTKYAPTYPGAMLSLPLSIPQTFLRFSSPTPTSDPSARFSFFTTTILPSLLPTSHHKPQSGTLLFVPSYYSCLTISTYLSTHPSCTSLSFGSITEYTAPGEVARARSHFANSRHSLLLYTERAHHFRRYKMIRGVKRVLFFGVPENPGFWSEVLGWLDRDGETKGSGRGSVKTLFSKWDVLKLERIVGTERVGRMIGGDEGDVFEFV